MASNKCTTKRLSTLLTACLKTILTHYKQYCEGMYKRTGVNCFWVIENSMEVMEKLRRHQRPDAFKLIILPHCILVYIPHDMLKSSIRTLVREAYKVRGAKYLVIDRLNRAHWSEVPSSVTTCMNVDKGKLINWMEYLIDSVYIKVGNKVYRQTVGIPMGRDCAPQLANLFLFHSFMNTYT